jgi:hypothetical protein
MTILEMATQSCIDSSMQLFISFSDFDIKAPSNINNNEMDKSTKLTLLSKPSVIAGELEGSWRAVGQQEGLQYNGEAA